MSVAADRQAEGDPGGAQLLLGEPAGVCPSTVSAGMPEPANSSLSFCCWAATPVPVARADWAAWSGGGAGGRRRGRRCSRLAGDVVDAVADADVELVPALIRVGIDDPVLPLQLLRYPLVGDGVGDPAQRVTGADPPDAGVARRARRPGRNRCRRCSGRRARCRRLGRGGRDRRGRGGGRRYPRWWPAGRSCVVAGSIVADGTQDKAADDGGSPPGGSASSPDRDDVQAPRRSKAAAPPTNAAISRSRTYSLYGPRGARSWHPAADVSGDLSRGARRGGS